VETDHGYNDHRIALQMSGFNWLQSLGAIEKETGSPGRTESRAEAGGSRNTDFQGCGSTQQTPIEHNGWASAKAGFLDDARMVGEKMVGHSVPLLNTPRHCRHSFSGSERGLTKLEGGYV
jgi:hypothetical protein